MLKEAEKMVEVSCFRDVMHNGIADMLIYVTYALGGGKGPQKRIGNSRVA